MASRDLMLRDSTLSNLVEETRDATAEAIFTIGNNLLADGSPYPENYVAFAAKFRCFGRKLLWLRSGFAKVSCASNQRPAVALSVIGFPAWSLAHHYFANVIEMMDSIHLSIPSSSFIPR